VDDANLEVAELGTAPSALQSQAGDDDDDDRSGKHDKGDEGKGKGKGKHKGDKGDGDHDDVGNCHEGDNDHHRGHHHHFFKVLDKLDGQRDHVVTLANLPSGLPPLLLAALEGLDANHDGVVTKDEAKAALDGAPPPPASAPIID
jgi:hypothetical protein